MHVAATRLLGAHPVAAAVDVVDRYRRRELERRREELREPERSAPVDLGTERPRKDALGFLRRVGLIDDRNPNRVVILLVRHPDCVAERKTENLERRVEVEARHARVVLETSAVELPRPGQIAVRELAVPIDLELLLVGDVERRRPVEEFPERQSRRADAEVGEVLRDLAASGILPSVATDTNRRRPKLL